MLSLMKLFRKESKVDLDNLSDKEFKRLPFVEDGEPLPSEYYKRPLTGRFELDYHFTFADRDRNYVNWNSCHVDFRVYYSGLHKVPRRKWDFEVIIGGSYLKIWRMLHGEKDAENRLITCQVMEKGAVQEREEARYMSKGYTEELDLTVDYVMPDECLKWHVPYRPDRARSDQLKDDWRLFVAHYSNKRQGKESPYTYEDLYSWAAECLRELARRKERGLTNFRIHEEEYSKDSSVGQFWSRVRRKLKPSEVEVLKKAKSLADQYCEVQYNLDRMTTGRTAVGDYDGWGLQQLQREESRIRIAAREQGVDLPSKEECRQRNEKKYPDFYKWLATQKAEQYPENCPALIKRLAKESPFDDPVIWFEGGSVGARHPRAGGGYWDAWMVRWDKGEIRTGVQRPDLKEFFLYGHFIQGRFILRVLKGLKRGKVGLKTPLYWVMFRPIDQKPMNPCSNKDNEDCHMDMGDWQVYGTKELFEEKYGKVRDLLEGRS